MNQTRAAVRVLKQEQKQKFVNQLGIGAQNPPPVGVAGRGMDNSVGTLKLIYLMAKTHLIKLQCGQCCLT